MKRTQYKRKENRDLDLKRQGIRGVRYDNGNCSSVRAEAYLLGRRCHIWNGEVTQAIVARDAFIACFWEHMKRHQGLRTAYYNGMDNDPTSMLAFLQGLDLNYKFFKVNEDSLQECRDYFSALGQLLFGHVPTVMRAKDPKDIGKGSERVPYPPLRDLDPVFRQCLADKLQDYQRHVTKILELRRKGEKTVPVTLTERLSALEEKTRTDAAAQQRNHDELKRNLDELTHNHNELAGNLDEFARNLDELTRNHEEFAAAQQRNQQRDHEELVGCITSTDQRIDNLEARFQSIEEKICERIKEQASRLDKLEKLCEAQVLLKSKTKAKSKAKAKGKES